MKLIFGDETKCVREVLVRSFRAERKAIYDRLGKVYEMHFGHVGLDNDSNAVLILDAYNDLHPKHPLRIEWCRRVETAYESNEWDKVPFLVYYLGSFYSNDNLKHRTPKLALIPQASFVRYQRKETESDLIPVDIQRKVLMNTPLSDEEQAICNARREQVQAQDTGTSWRPSFVISDLEDLVIGEILAAARIQTNEPPLDTPLHVYLPCHKAYFEGTVKEIRKNATFYRILYDDDQDDWVDLSEETYELLDTNILQQSSRIQVYWAGDKTYYQGTVVEVRSDATFCYIDFKDGDERWLPRDFKYSFKLPSTCSPSKQTPSKACLLNRLSERTMNGEVLSTTSIPAALSPNRSGDRPIDGELVLSTSMTLSPLTTEGERSKEKSISDANHGASLSERTMDDGSVLPKIPPRKDKNGLFVQPQGRPILGCVWNARTGIWVRDCSNETRRQGKRALPNHDYPAPKKTARDSIVHTVSASSAEENIENSQTNPVPVSSKFPKDASKLSSRQRFQQLRQYLLQQEGISNEKHDHVKDILHVLINSDISYSAEDDELYKALKNFSKKDDLNAELKELSSQLFEKIREAFMLSLIEKWKISMENQDVDAFVNSMKEFQKSFKKPKKNLQVLSKSKGILEKYGYSLPELVKTTKCFCETHRLTTPGFVADLEKLSVNPEPIGGDK